jgi:hypothetical protein
MASAIAAVPNKVADMCLRRLGMRNWGVFISSPSVDGLWLIPRALCRGVEDHGREPVLQIR